MNGAKGVVDLAHAIVGEGEFEQRAVYRSEHAPVAFAYRIDRACGAEIPAPKGVLLQLVHRAVAAKPTALDMVYDNIVEAVHRQVGQGVAGG